jgi:glycosyltransferase involved in cell wall biosynthesis
VSGAERRAPEVSIVVPVFNNESTLDELIDRIVAALEPLGVPFEMVMIDDGSRDGSLGLLLRRAAADPRLRVYAMMRNFGGQSAICAGFDRVRGRRAVCLDADLENHPEDIPRLLAKLDEGYDLVCGVRENRRDPWLTRRVPSAFMNWYVGRQTGMNVRDIGCGLRAMDASILRNLASEGERRRLVTPMLLRRAHAVVEVPIGHTPSSLRLGHSFLTLLGIAADYYLLTARRPFLVSGLVALAATVVGIALGSIALVRESPALGITAVVLGSAGLLGGLLSLVGDYMQRVYQLGQGLPFYMIRDDVGAAAEAGDPAQRIAAAAQRP